MQVNIDGEIIHKPFLPIVNIQPNYLAASVKVIMESLNTRFARFSRVSHIIYMSII